jgi:hypothetical protein
MKLLGLFLFLSACAKPVTIEHLMECEDLCYEGIQEISVSYVKGWGCACQNGKKLWLELDDAESD